MKFFNKTTISSFFTLVSLGVLATLFVMQETNKVYAIAVKTKNDITEDIDKTKKYIQKKIRKKTRSGRVKKKEIIKTAKKIQEKINETTDAIEEKIEKVAEKVSTGPKINSASQDKIKETVHQTKRNLKRELKIACKKVRGQIVRMLREKNKENILAHAKQITKVTDQTCETIKKNINDAYNQIKLV